MKRNLVIPIFIALAGLIAPNWVGAQSPTTDGPTVQMLTRVGSFSGGRGAPAGPLIGPAGGHVVSPSGGLVLDVPPGALASEVLISITEREPDEGPFVGSVYDLEPGGLQFLQPATLTIHFSPDQVPEGYRIEDIAIIEVTPAEGETGGFDDQMPEEEAFPVIDLNYMDTEIDIQAGAARVQIKHFSSYAARAYSTYKLGDLEYRRLRGIFDGGQAASTSFGAGASHASYSLAGFLEVAAAVPIGSEGAATGTAVIAKWFLVKASDSGASTVDDGTIGVQVLHNGLIGARSNNYHIVMAVTCADAYGHFIGEPMSLSSSPTRGQFTDTGYFMQVYHLDPYGTGNTEYPLGPPYTPGTLDVIFRNCQLVAGEWYIVGVNLVGNVWGFPPAEYVPASGGWTEWTGTSPGEFLIMGVTVEG